MSSLNVTDALPVDPAAVIALAREAGHMIVSMQAHGLSEITTKSTDIDLVTEADVASERFLSEGLAALAPQIGFWGEESNQAPDSEYFWIVDPIDGTVNYASGVPNYSISIALNHRDETLFGLVLKLPSADLYWSVRGQGAFHVHPDGREDRLQVNRVDRLDQATLTTGFPYHRAQHADNNSAEFVRMLPLSRSIRCLGSAAVDLALVASGATSAHWEAWLNPWDIAAGKLLIEEAGGIVTTYGNQPYQLNSRSCIASNGQLSLHHAIAETVQAARATLAERLFDE